MIEEQDYSDIESLLRVMARLRDPDGGCPWDLEQDFKSIAPHTLEEAYEVADAIERADMDDLREELGDLLLQVVFHAQMAAEQGDFSFPDVVREIVAKLIRRHPHVFGEETRNTAGEVLTRWDEIKAAEKAAKREARQHDGADGLLADVPANLPGLTQAVKLQKKAAKVGFDWQSASGVADKVEEELGELRAAVAEHGDATEPQRAGDMEKAEEELGDLLFSCANLARWLKIDPEAALRRANLKFRSRFNAMEQAAGEAELGSLTAAELETLWQKAKATESGS